MLTVQIPTNAARDRMQTDYAPTPPPPAVPSLPTLLQAMALGLEDLHGAITTLAGRMEPILVPGTYEWPVAQKPEGMTMVAGAVYDAAASIEDARKRLDALTKAIDL